MWWKIILFVWIAAFSAAGILVPVAGTLTDVEVFGRLMPGKTLPVLVHFESKDAETSDDGRFLARAVDKDGHRATLVFEARPADFDAAGSYLLLARKDVSTGLVHVSAITATNPGWTFPYIPGLEERAKIIFFHVPMAWLTVIAFLVSMWYGMKYLRRKNLDDDMKSAVSAGLGLLFCVLATTTGSVWAKFNWGSFWNWDPRETSIFVLLLIYGAYFALRSAIEIDEKKAALSAVYSILAFVTVPFFIFIMPRLMPGLHPGSAGDVNSGPAVSGGGMDAGMRVVLYGMVLGFLALYIWLMRIRITLQRIQHDRSAPVA